MKRIARSVLPGLVVLMLWLPLAAQDLASFEKRTTVKKLANGLTVVIYERPNV